MIPQPQQQGFIALLSAIIISFVLLSTTITLGMSGFFRRADTLESEYKEYSLALAESCSDAALLRIANNSAYVPVVGGDSISVGSDTCLIRSVQPNLPIAGQITITTQAIFKKAVTNMQIVVNASTLDIVSWNEVP